MRYVADEEEGAPRRGAFGFPTRRASVPAAASVGAADKPQFRVGMRVVHRMMGSGLIVEMGGRPGWERVVIQFNTGKTQDFVVKYAPITPET